MQPGALSVGFVGSVSTVGIIDQWSAWTMPERQCGFQLTVAK
jgi:hypothetical protein